MDSRAYWIWLQNGLGAAGALSKCLAFYSSAEEMYNAGPDDWRACSCVSAKQLSRLVQYSPRQAVKTIELCEKNSWSIVCPDDTDYPELLLKTNSLPAALYVWGDLSRIRNKIPLAVVGTRKPLRESLKISRSISGELANAGFCIISGGALGIDSSAHEAALQANAPTVAVLGCGLGERYLMENHALRCQIAESGAVISEFPPFTAASMRTFPIRNRIISGMSCGTLVIEAGERSGSLITAGYAAEQGRDVFAIPGDITGSTYSGANKLIRDGAKPVFSAYDIFSEYSLRFPGVISPALLEQSHSGTPATRSANEKPPASSKEAVGNIALRIPKKPVSSKPDLTGFSEYAKKVFLVFKNVPVHCDDIVRETALPPGTVVTALTELELAGKITMISGKRYTIKD